MTALAHDAFLYSGDDEFAASMVPFLRDGLDRGEDVVAVTAPSNRAFAAVPAWVVCQRPLTTAAR